MEGVRRGGGEGRCAIRTESQFGKMTKVWGRPVGWLHNRANVPDATELDT